jgi:hypothetical protein
MRRPSRSPLLTLLCLSLLLQGCQTWARYDVPTEPAPPSAVPGGRPVRVSMRDGTELMMHGTRVIGDSIVGDGTGAMGRIAVPVAGVRTVEELRTNRTLNTLAIVAGAVVALAGLALFALVQAMGNS